MTSRTGNLARPDFTVRPPTRPTRRAAGAFTLVELLLVMAMLVVVLGVSFPTLKVFFRGRNLDSEARRFLSLTRYGQSRAISEGIPMLLWIDSANRSYGLQAQPGYLDRDENAVQYTLDPSLEIEAETHLLKTTMATWRPALPGLGNVPMIRFMPDGFIGETSPDRIVLRQADNAEIWIAAQTNRLSFAIQTNALPIPITRSYR